MADYNGYYTYDTMTAKLREYAATYAAYMKMWTLGQSIQGRELWALELSTTLGNQTALKPNVKYIGNMHGDEVVGRELLMRFVERLVKSIPQGGLGGFSSDPEAYALLEAANVFVVPTMNPDGFALGRRGNANNVDLNRNFPDQFRGAPASPEQTEVRLIRTFLASRQWTLSANFHGGDAVANYPWDGRPDNRLQGENASPDDDGFRMISMAYAHSNSDMMLNSDFRDGITNGAAWYVLYGGMQDYNYIHEGCMEVTLEVSFVKWPPGAQLPSFYDKNKASMLTYLLQVQQGVRGIITDASTGHVLANASVTVGGRERGTIIRSRQENGAYFRILPPGSFQLIFSAPGYTTQLVNVQVPNAFATSTLPYARVDVALMPTSVPVRVPEVPVSAPQSGSSPSFAPPASSPSSIPPLTPLSPSSNLPPAVLPPQTPPQEATKPPVQLLPFIASPASVLWSVSAIALFCGFVAVIVIFGLYATLKYLGVDILAFRVLPTSSASHSPLPTSVDDLQLSSLP